MSNKPVENRPQSRIDYAPASRALQEQAPASDNAIARHQEYLSARLSKIKEWIVGGVQPEALIRFTLREMAGDKGIKLRECTPVSIYLALLACAVTGLEPGSLKQEAFLIPYKNKGVSEAEFRMGWRGLVKLARRSGLVTAIWSEVVFEADLYKVDKGTAHYLRHEPAISNRGEIVGAYAIAKLSNGEHEIETMDLDDLLAVRKASANGPAWSDWADQMYRKAPLIRLCKRLPMGSDYFTALNIERAGEYGGARAQREILDVEVGGEATRATIANDNAASMLAQAGRATIANDNSPTAEEQAEIARLEREAAHA